MNNDKVIFESPHGRLQVLQTPNGFYFARRKGRHSVAVFLLRRVEGEWEVLIRQQPLPMANAGLGEAMQLFPCPITGSYKSDELPEECAIRETHEEAGYRLGHLNYLGVLS